LEQLQRATARDKGLVILRSNVISLPARPFLTSILLTAQVYFASGGGKKDILIGKASVLLANLEEDFLHDMWLHLRPSVKERSQNEAERRFLEKWEKSDLLGSVHVLIQKSRNERVRTARPLSHQFPLG